MKIEKFEKRGSFVAREGTKCEKIYIMKEGEFEIVKTDLNNVFYNESTGNVAIQESDGKTMIRSQFMVRPCDQELEQSKGKPYAYIGSILHQEVLHILSKTFKDNKGFGDAHRSKFD